jgi:broad specificity phosphatase PhoE
VVLYLLKGKSKQKKIAHRLKHESFDKVYSSDLARASNTAVAIHKYHVDTPIEFTSLLLEYYYGSWQGRCWEDIKKEYGADMPSRPKDAESYSQTYDRASGLLENLLRVHEHDTLLLVGHNGINRALIAAIKGEGHESISQIPHLENTSLTVYELDKDRTYESHIFNCAIHLK